MVAYVTPNGVCITAAEIWLLLCEEPRCPRSVHQCLMLKNKPWNWAVVSCVDRLWCIASFLLFCGSYLCHHELESGYLRLIWSQKWMWMWQTEVKLEFQSYFWLIFKKKIENLNKNWDLGVDASQVGQLRDNVLSDCGFWNSPLSSDGVEER